MDWLSFGLGVFATLGAIALWLAVEINREEQKNVWEFEPWRGP